MNIPDGTGANPQRIETKDPVVSGIIDFIELHPHDTAAYDDMLTIMKDRMFHGLYGTSKDWHRNNRVFRNQVVAIMNQLMGNRQFEQVDEFNGIYRRSLLIDAPVDFDAFNLYLEINRDPNEQFYLPRRKVLAPIVRAFQEVQDGEIDLLTVSQPKRTGKTTLGTRFVLFRGGQHPNGSSVCSGSGDMLVKSFYNGMLEIVRDPEKYTFNEIFPDAVLVNTNADEKIFNLKDVRRFATVTCRSIDGALTGSTEATPDGVLYLDDMVANEEEAVNLARLDFLWDKIRGDLLGRRLEGCPIVAQGTRYSVHDPIGHLQEEAPRMGWRTKVLEIPALDPVTDESNFEIEINGRKMFTTAFYRNERKLVTEQQWESQFQQRPFEKKGRLYKANELRRYFDLPADREPDAIIAVCDTKDRGKDYASMPIGYQYGNDYFIEDVVCDNGVSAMVREKLALALVRNNVQIAQFESNSAGGLIAEDVTKRVKELGGTTSIRTKFTSENKETKIIVNQPWVLEHCLFKDESRYKPDSDYGIFMRFLTQYTMSGKGQIDDPPDSMAMFAIFAQGQRVATVTPMRRPW